DSYIIPVTASFIGLPVTINGIGTLVLSVCDVNKGKINQHVWQALPVSEYAYHIVFGHHQYPGCQKTIFKRQGSDIDIFSGIFTINNRP
ncbi:hypothetical protein DEN96_27945, partial [Escherichia coli]